MFENLSLKAKILMGSGVTLSFLVIVGFVSLNSIGSLQTTNAWVDHTHEVIQEAMKIEASAVDMETGMRGYLLAGQEEFLGPYKQGKKHFEQQIKALKSTVSDNPAQVTLLGDVETTIEEWQSNVTESAIALRTEIGDAKTMNDMAALVAEARGKKYFDKFRSQITTFIGRERVFLKKRHEATENTNSIEELHETMAWINHTNVVIQEAMKIEAAAVDMETGMRGYLLAGKEEFLAPYKSGRKRFGNILNALKVTVNDNPLQVTLLGSIETTIEDWQSNVTESAINLRHEIGDAKTMDDMALLVGEARGKKYFDKFRDQIATFRDRELALMAQRQQDAEQTVQNTTYTLIAGVLIAVLISLIIAYVLSNSITKPFQNIFRGLTNFSANELKELSDAFGGIVRKMSVSAGKVGAVAGNITSVSQNLSQITNRQASSVEETSASTEEISGMVNNNVKSAEQSRDQSNQMGTKLGDLNDAMEKIADSNQQIAELVKIIGEIGDKTQIIDEIVFQTKLLSFNASVEAERAGEHGRGFAVVAQEVGNLAQMSGKAASDIATIVKQSVSEAETIARENTKRVEDGTQIVADTRERSMVVANGASEIFEASNEQAKGIMEISSAIESINKATQHGATIADQAAGSSGELSRQADELNRLVRSLNGFLKGHDTSYDSQSIALREDATDLDHASVVEQGHPSLLVIDDVANDAFDRSMAAASGNKEAWNKL